jgi:hypothetical protein
MKKYLIKRASDLDTLKNLAKKDLLKAVKSYYNLYNGDKEEFEGKDTSRDGLIDELKNLIYNYQMFDADVYYGDCSDYICDKMENEGLDSEDETEFFNYVAKLLPPYDNLHEFVFENGWTDEAFKVIDDLSKTLD